MKNKTLKEKFNNNILVRPLYRKVATRGKAKQVPVIVDSIYKLEGNEISVKRHISHVNGGNIKVGDKRSLLPGESEYVDKNYVKVTPKVFLVNDYNIISGIKMVEGTINGKSNEVVVTNDKVNKFVQLDKPVIPQYIADTWLRLVPLPKLPNESIYSVIFRCVLCQLGLATVLITWTLISVFAIHSFEGPHELQVSLDFEREQNQLVIDLATELRQITPVSSKWRDTIERRIEEERKLTFLAVGRGARINPGQFWDLPGTFLFTVYVMTALGFGAPVPQTIGGRSSALIYALLAVPTHIYLMVNASTYLTIKLEACCCRRKKTLLRRNCVENKPTAENNPDSPNCSRYSELIKTNSRAMRNKVVRLLYLPCACRCVPLAAILYYACGAVAFGVLRDRLAVEILMFPLEFTTTGGLEQVQGYVRILYGLYVEGAMALLACALAALRRHSGAGVNFTAHKYRLFAVHSD